MKYNLKNMLSRPLLTLGIVGLLIQSAALAETPQEKGLRIAQEAKASDRGWVDSQSTMTMTLRNARGQESVRQMRSKDLEIIDDGDKGLNIFDHPKDIKGTAFLSFSHITGADDQWLYLPALKRVKRIASRNKSGPFLGSEFAFEDLASFEVEKFSFIYLRDEPCGELTCYVIEQDPLDEYSGYSRIVAWIDQTAYRAQKVDYYDRRGKLLKTLNYSEYRQYLNKHWRPHLLMMENHKNGKSTDLKMTEYRFKTGLSDKDFNKNSLKRAH